MNHVLPTVGIVTPSYNHGDYIADTVRSVLAQDYPRLTYRVLDAGSTDQTLRVLAGFAGDLRFSYVSGPDAGQADAINRGLGGMRGEVLAWLNSDDTYAPGAVAAAAEFLAAHPRVAMVYGDADFIDADGRFIAGCAQVGPFSQRRLLRESDFIVQPSAFFRRWAFEAVGGLDASLHWAMDYDLWLKIARQYPVAYLPRVLAHYRWLGASKTAAGGEARLAEVRRVAARYGQGQPAWFVLEEVGLRLAQSWRSGRGGRWGEAAKSLAAAGLALATSGPALLSLLDSRTWRVTWTGQVLRARARSVR